MWAAVLLYSATRSSYVAVCKSDDVDKQPSRLDASDADGPLAVAAPWRIACVAERRTKEGAEAVASAVAKCGGFRARFRACEALRLAAPSRDAPPAAAVADALSSIDLGLHGDVRRGRRAGRHDLRVGGRAPSRQRQNLSGFARSSTRAARTASSRRTSSGGWACRLLAKPPTSRRPWAASRSSPSTRP